jgi:hypothetical protein
MTETKSQEDLELTPDERQHVLERRQRAERAQKATDDAREAKSFLRDVGIAVTALKLGRLERFCFESALSDEAQIGALTELFGDACLMDTTQFKQHQAIYALILRTEAARQAKRDEAAREIQNHPRDY